MTPVAGPEAWIPVILAIGGIITSIIAAVGVVLTNMNVRISNNAAALQAKEVQTTLAANTTITTANASKLEGVQDKLTAATTDTKLQLNDIHVLVDGRLSQALDEIKTLKDQIQGAGIHPIIPPKEIDAPLIPPNPKPRPSAR